VQPTSIANIDATMTTTAGRRWRPSCRRRRVLGSVLLLALTSADIRSFRFAESLTVGSAFGKVLQGSSALSPPDANVDVYVRLSPLVGGPKFLPLHAEIMILASGDAVFGTDESGINSLREGLNGRVLHRFDFLPENPTDPATLARLLSLQSVPGLARYRTLPRGSDDQVVGEDVEADLVALGTRSIERMLEGGNNGLVFRLGSIDSVINEVPIGSDQISAVSNAVKFTELYQKDRGDLNIVSNGCHTFALGLISHLGGYPALQGNENTSRTRR